MDYDNGDLTLCDNGDGTFQLTGNIINGRDADWDPSTGTACGAQDGWLVDTKCETASKLTELRGSKRGGCRPVPLRHHFEGSTLVVAENDILAGWRLFR